MYFLAIAISLLIDRFILDSDSYRSHNWFRRYAELVAQNSFADKTFSSNLGLLVVLAPVVLIVAWLQTSFTGFIFNTIVLLFCLGPIDLDRQVNQLIDADDSGDQEDVDRLTEQIAGQPLPDDPQEVSRMLGESIFIQACCRLFGVIFWFALLGPMGAVLYRLTAQLKSLHPDSETSQRLLNILNWVPARLAALAYAISGSFDDALQGWKQHYRLIAQYHDDHTAPILAGAGMGALKLDESEMEALPSAPAVAESALNLVWRAIFVWLGVIGVIYFLQ